MSTFPPTRLLPPRGRAGVERPQQAPPKYEIIGGIIDTTDGRVLEGAGDFDVKRLGTGEVLVIWIPPFRGGIPQVSPGADASVGVSGRIVYNVVTPTKIQARLKRVTDAGAAEDGLIHFLARGLR